MKRHGRRLEKLPAAVLFDLDGTLVSTHEAWQRAAEKVAERCGIRLGAADLPHIHGRSAQDAASYIDSRSNCEMDREQILTALINQFALQVSAGIEVREGTHQVLAMLWGAGITMAVVSAAPRRVVDLVLSHLGTSWFTLVLAAEDTRRTKPDPDPYLTAAQLLGTDPRSCIAVEDSLTGIESARSAGCKVVMVPSTAPVTPIADVTVLSSLAELALPVLTSVLQPDQEFPS
jgi:HAD superfamily hydrolase (TIGR01509 family)